MCKISETALRRNARARSTALATACTAALCVVSATTAFAQTVVPPAPTPFEAPTGAPPITSSSANGRLGAAPVAPRADQLARPTPIDAGAARAAAERGLPATVPSATTLEGDRPLTARPDDAIAPAGVVQPTPGLVMHPKETVR